MKMHRNSRVTDTPTTLCTLRYSHVHVMPSTLQAVTHLFLYGTPFTSEKKIKSDALWNITKWNLLCFSSKLEPKSLKYA